MNEFLIVGAVGARPAVRALDRGRVHQARFEVWTGEDAIACQLTRSDSKGLRRLTDGLEAGRMVVVTGILDTRVAEVGGVRLPILIPFVQHVQTGEVLPGTGTESASGVGAVRVPIGFTRFRVDGMVAAQLRRSSGRRGRGFSAQVSVRCEQRTLTVGIGASSADELDRKVVGIVPGAEVSAVGFLRNRTAGGGLSFLEAVSFSVRIVRPVVMEADDVEARGAGLFSSGREALESGVEPGNTSEGLALPVAAEAEGVGALVRITAGALA